MGLSAQRWPPQEPSFSPGSSGSQREGPQREGPQRERPQPPGSRCHFPCVLLAGRVTSLGEGGLTRLPRDRAPSWRSRRRRPRVVPHAGHLPSGQFRSLKAGTVTSPTAAASRECNTTHTGNLEFSRSHRGKKSKDAGGVTLHNVFSLAQYTPDVVATCSECQTRC